MSKIKYLIPILLLMILIVFSKKQIKNIDVDDLVQKQTITSFVGDIESTSIFDGKGLVYYEKPNKFRLIFNMKSDKKIDIGSNDKFYWFWYKSFSKYIHYWNRNSISDVIPEFHPDFIKQTIDLDFKNSIILKSNENYELTNFLIINGQIIKKIIAIKDGKIKCFLYDGDENILSFEILEFESDICIIPKKIKLNSSSFGSIIIKINNIRINQKIPEDIWEISNENSIDISK